MFDPVARPTWLREAVGEATGHGVSIGLVDSGRDVDWDEPRIRPGLGLTGGARGLDLEETSDDRDRLGHGTAAADVLLRLAPGVEIHPLRVFGDRLETSPEIVEAALDRAVERGVSLVNLSLGTTLEDAAPRLEVACARARAAGVAVIAAAPAGSEPSYPAVLPGVLGVTAGEFTSPYGLRHRPDRAVEFEANGKARVRWLGGDLRDVHASSLAAPHLTALAALLLERFAASGPDVVRDLLVALAARSPS